MSVSPPVHAPSSNDGDRQDSESPYFPRISGANTVARPSLLHASMDDAFPSVKLQAKMVKQTPLPYQTQEFRPCIVLKRFEPTVRVSDSLVPGVQTDDMLGEFKKKRTVILHTDRYTHQGQLILDSDSQKVRLAQEGQMLQDARSRMRLREALAHRARHDLHLGGNNPLAAAEDSAAEAAATETSTMAKKKRKQRRLKRPPRPDQQQQQLGYILEEAGASAEHGGNRGGRRGQLASHSSPPSLPALHMGQHRGGPGHQAAAASFVSRAELDALTALIGSSGNVGDAAAADSAFCSSGLDKVKLDGSKAVFNRRSDILAELTRLKAIVLPDFARDLYVGRGIRLPGSHGLNNPRGTVNADDPILEALLNRAQQPTRVIDDAGNILLSTSGGAGQPRRQQQRQVFVADVTAKPKHIDNPSEPTQAPPPLPEAPSEEPASDEQMRPAAAAAAPEPLPEPFLGLPAEWMRRDEAATDAGGEDPLTQLQLPSALADYLLAIRAASGHARAKALTLELGRLVEQRLATAGGSSGSDGWASLPEQLHQPHSLIGWLRRGLDLFHDVDREVKGSVSVTAFLDILSSMRGSPLEEGESAQVRDLYGLSGDSVSKLAFLTVLPFLLAILNRRC